LGTLLLSKHFILLGDDFGLVLEDEGKGKPDEEGGSGHYPDDISGNFSRALEERGSI
jgi:hypothetical protein